MQPYKTFLLLFIAKKLKIFYNITFYYLTIEKIIYFSYNHNYFNKNSEKGYDNVKRFFKDPDIFDGR